MFQQQQRKKKFTMRIRQNPNSNYFNRMFSHCAVLALPSSMCAYIHASSCLTNWSRNGQACERQRPCSHTTNMWMFQSGFFIHFGRSYSWSCKIYSTMYIKLSEFVTCTRHIQWNGSLELCTYQICIQRNVIHLSNVACVLIFVVFLFWVKRSNLWAINFLFSSSFVYYHWAEQAFIFISYFLWFELCKSQFPYSFWLIQRLFYGAFEAAQTRIDGSKRENRTVSWEDLCHLQRYIWRVYNCPPNRLLLLLCLRFLRPVLLKNSSNSFLKMSKFTISGDVLSLSIK